MPLTSFYTALTGLNNNSAAINVIGDNLANMNTAGFKSGSANFSELLAGLSGTSTTGNPITLGLGSTLNGVTRMNTQGTITNTGQSTDAAINGNGFFVVQTEGGMGFTRSGKFELSSQGNLINSDGFQVMGYNAVNGVVDYGRAPSPITISKGQIIPAITTANVTISGNMDSASDSFSIPTRIIDSLGTPHEVTLNFTRAAMVRDPVTGVATTTWDWDATIAASEIEGATAPVSIGSGSMEFVNGLMTTPATNPVLDIAGLSSGAADMQVTFNLLDSNGNPAVTSSDLPGLNLVLNQDGLQADILKNVSIGDDGIITGSSVNGRSMTLAQLALADFPNVEGLQKYKGSTLISFPSSGEPSIGIAGTGTRGQVVGFSLEKSNVDMAQEFINLIVAQRAYQANSRVITTTDELYQESINLKR